MKTRLQGTTQATAAASGIAFVVFVTVLVFIIALAQNTETGPPLLYLSSRFADNSEVVLHDIHHAIVHNLTRHPEWDGVPARSRTGETAFVSLRDDNMEIYTMSALGGNVRRLTENDARDTDPAWSPDGAWIIFNSDRDGNWNLYRMRVDGSEQTRLTDNPADDQTPAWSPDGSQIAFNSYFRGNWQLFMMDTEGDNVREATTYANARSVAPSWSPDGTLIAFASDREERDFDIYTMRADGSDVRRVLVHPGMDINPAWSPDGREIRFESRVDGDAEIYIVTTDGSNLRRITDNDERDSDPG